MIGWGTTMKPKNTFRTNAAAAAAPAPTRQQIEALAHAIWLDQGCPLGRDWDHWLEAERQLQEQVGGRIRDPDITAAKANYEALDKIVEPPAPRSPTAL